MANKAEAEDDFDDILDQFTAPANPPTAGPSRPEDASQSKNDGDLDDDAFLAEFTKNMRAVLSDAPPLSGAGASNSEDLPKGDEEKIRKLFTEALQKDFGLGAEQQQQGGGTGISEEDLKDAFSMIDQQLGLNPQQPSQQPPPQPSTSTGGSFQDTLRATSERLRSSENAARNSAGQDFGSQPDMVRLLASLGGAAGTGQGGEEDEEGLQDAIELMMGQLMSKELLYEPMADLKARYPDYLKEHNASLSSEDRQRYEKQHGLVCQIVDIFEKHTYDENDPAQKEEIVSLMTKMQDCGTPPKEMMGELPPGLNFGEDGALPDLNNCPTS